MFLIYKYQIPTKFYAKNWIKNIIVNTKNNDSNFLKFMFLSVKICIFLTKMDVNITQEIKYYFLLDKYDIILF